MGGPGEKMQKILNEQQAYQEYQKQAKALKDQGYEMSTTYVTDDDSGKGTYSGTGTKKGTTTTTTGPSTYTYEGKKDKNIYDILNKEISGGLAQRKYGYTGTDVKEYEQIKLARRKGQKGVIENPGKTTTVTTPDEKKEIKVDFGPEEKANENDGSSAADTDTSDDDDTTTTTPPPGKTGPMPPALAKPTGTGGKTKMNRPAVAADPLLASSGSPSAVKDYDLKLNNQAVNKA